MNVLRSIYNIGVLNIYSAIRILEINFQQFCIVDFINISGFKVY